MVPRVVPTLVAALGIVLAVVGLVMITVAAPPQQVGGTAVADPVLVTAPGVLALTGEPVEVLVTDPAFVGVGRAVEVEAFLAGVARTEVEGVLDETTLRTTTVSGAEPAQVEPPADPTAADIWQRETTGEEPLAVPLPRADEVLVVVAAGADDVEVALTWQRPARHPGAWPLLVLGLLQAVLGTVWLVLLNARRRRRRVPA